MASAQCQKPNTAIEVCQPKSHHSSFGQKISEMKNKAFKGHLGRHGSNQNQQLQCYSQTQTESHGHNTSAKSETHCYGQAQTQHDKKHGVSKAQITVTVVQAQITQTNEDTAPYGATTTCFRSHARKNGESNNKKERNFFRRIRDGMSRHSNDRSSSSSSSESDSDDEKKCPERKRDNEKCPKSKD